MPLPLTQKPAQTQAESYQVGDACYVSIVAAANAACAAHKPVTVITDDAIRHSSCAGVTSEGALVLTVADSPLDGGTVTYMQVEAPQWFMPCQEKVKWEAYMAIFGAVLGLAAISYALWQVYETINRNSRTAE